MLDWINSLSLKQLVVVSLLFVGSIYVYGSILISINKGDGSDKSKEGVDDKSVEEIRKKEVDLAWWQEEVLNIKGVKVVRTKSGLFYLLGWISLFAGFAMIAYEIPAGSFLFLNCTILFLYPAVRYLFGGKDSLLGAAATVVVDAYVKSKIEESVKKRSKRR